YLGTSNTDKSPRGFVGRILYSLAFVHLGYLYEYGYGVGQDYEQAKRYYKQAVQLEDAKGELRLALLYLRGQGGAVDKEKAILLLQSSASKGNSYAKYHLSLLSS
ncbi:tetratricopeptide repeat protein, partial [Vibrio sp. 10N.247.310.17]|uniref:tetratricopeptide repeat protein n=1 Tax=Vibrio sp. 10N.247.310.17 TaxID=3229979 RepID=UPI00354DBEA7